MTETFKAAQVLERVAQSLAEWSRGDLVDEGLVVTRPDGTQFLAKWGWYLIKRPVDHPKFEAAPFYALPVHIFESNFEEGP